jgi:hypothetical protein
MRSQYRSAPPPPPSRDWGVGVLIAGSLILLSSVYLLLSAVWR